MPQPEQLKQKENNISQQTQMKKKNKKDKNKYPLSKIPPV
jgi:hypothetical protein